MKEKINITFFVHSLNSGGLENYLLRFLLHTAHNFSNIYIFCKSGTAGQLENEFLAIPNVTIIKSKISYVDLFSLRGLKHFFKSNKINAICDFTGNFAGLTLVTAYTAGINKRIAFYRSSTDLFKGNILKNTYNNTVNFLVKSFATDILSNSEAALYNYFGLGWQDNSKYQVIHNGIDATQLTKTSKDLRNELNIPDSAFIIGHTGRYTYAKNHRTIIRVAEQLIPEYCDIYFILCGNGVKDNLYDTIKNKGLSERFLVFNNRTDIPEFLNTMDCYFFPSITEGQPNALIEALIMGLPYVASNIPPIRETLISSENLYSPSDVDSFTRALISIYKTRPSRSNIQQMQYKDRFDHVKNFNEFYFRISS